jgi:BTB/POZ domain-containing protein 3/6
MSGSVRDEQGSSQPSGANRVSSPSPEEARHVVQEESVEGSSYTSMASKTVANIRRLQENMAVVSQPWSSPVLQLQGVPRQPVRGQAAPCVEQENCCVQPDSEVLQQQPENVETLTNFQKPLLVALPSPPPSPRPSSIASPESSLHVSTQDPNWQSNKSSVRERNSAMFNNSLMADIHFLVGPASAPKRIPAHRYVLATGSTVFYAMLYGGLADAECDDIAVPDVDPDAFLGLLKYLYCDDIYLEPDTVLAMLYAAKKYIVPHLARECVKYLETSLTARNACLLLSQSRLFEEPELMQRCWDVIDAQAEIALRSDGFTDIDYQTLQTILTRETLNCGELTVFLAAYEWARAECGRRGQDPTPEACRSILGPAMQTIRFPCMSVQEFADSPAQSGMLSLQETTDIFLNFTAKQKPVLEYPVTPRVGMKPLLCHRFQSSAYRSNQWRYRGRCDSIQFCVDKRIFIVGFGMYGSSNGSADYTVRIELKHSGKVLATNTQKFFSDGSSNTFHVFFDHPVQIEADKSYTASAVLDGAELSYFGQEGLSEVVVSQAPTQPVTFQFQCSAESTNGTGVQGGQIPEIIFYGPSPQ